MGELDFETLKAMDVEKFNEDMLALLSGETVEIPSFKKLPLYSLTPVLKLKLAQYKFFAFVHR